ncbi:MAG: hypothetical protein ACD_77C00037G0002 [uncultured bacterium]|nr:MAG: hypothetical protein ACD_77C00037G0002 [uncultured bacterium]
MLRRLSVDTEGLTKSSESKKASPPGFIVSFSLMVSEIGITLDSISSLSESIVFLS